MGNFKKKNFIFLFVGFFIFLTTISFAIGNKYQNAINALYAKNLIGIHNLALLIKNGKNVDFSFAKPEKPTEKENIIPAKILSKTLENPPAIIKAVYVTGWSAGSKKYLNYLENLFKTTQINAVVIDIKDYSGTISYTTKAKKAQEYNTYQNQIPDIGDLINRLHNQKIYVIGRITVFQDPLLAKNRPDLAIYDTQKTNNPEQPIAWENNNGLAWVDPASKEVWDYNIEIAKDAISYGFDEINFDYIRFPSDGQESNMGFPFWDQKTPKNFVIKKFFQFLRESLPDTVISADVFGQVTTSTDDMGIGQILEDSLAHFNYIYPMIYPSHYAKGFLGYQNPADHPYQIVKNSMDSALNRVNVYTKIYTKNNDQIKIAKIRPWLQDFNLGATYSKDMVMQEIKAVSDAYGADFNGYLLWNASNTYTQDAIIKE